MKLLYSRHQRVQTGFGIIEIMIALFLGVIIMLGVTQVATNNSNTRYELDRSGRQMENAAFALREIENDLTSAAFWGEKGAENAGAFPSVCPVDSAGLKQSMGYPVQGWSQDEVVGSNEFDCVTTDLSDTNRITPTVRTDYLAIRRASSCAVNDPDDPDCPPAVATNFHLQVHACANDSTNAGSFEVSNVLATLVYKKRDCVADAPQYRFLNRIYYIKNDQLIRAELVGADYTETVLVDGVEWMSLEYGMDRSTDLLGNPVAEDGQVDDDINGFTPSPTSDLNTDPPTENAFPPSAWSDVVMVRVSLILHNADASAGFTDDKVYTIAGETYCADDLVDADNDVYDGPCDLPDIPAAFENHRRQLYSRTVSLRNVAGRREEAP